jgi:hypothetical protein
MRHTRRHFQHSFISLQSIERVFLPFGCYRSVSHFSRSSCLRSGGSCVHTRTLSHFFLVTLHFALLMANALLMTGLVLKSFAQVLSADQHNPVFALLFVSLSFRSTCHTFLARAGMYTRHLLLLGSPALPLSALRGFIGTKPTLMLRMRHYAPSLCVHRAHASRFTVTPDNGARSHVRSCFAPVALTASEFT